MNKRKVDELIPEAYKVLSDVGIAKNGEINNKWRGQISSFGASVAQGSILAAVSFFSAKGSAEVDRSKLMNAIGLLLKIKEKDLFDYVRQSDNRKVKEEILNAAIALKLAMNLYHITKEENNSDGRSEQNES